MKKITLFLLAVFALGLNGCSKDAQIDSFLTEWENVTNEMVAKIDAGDVAGAKSVFDAKKESLKSRLDGVKATKGSQVSEEAKKKLEDSLRKNMTNLMNSVQDNVMKMSGDRPKAEQLLALSKEYTDLFKM